MGLQGVLTGEQSLSSYLGTSGVPSAPELSSRGRRAATTLQRSSPARPVPWLAALVSLAHLAGSPLIGRKGRSPVADLLKLRPSNYRLAQAETAVAAGDFRVSKDLKFLVA